MATGAPGPSLRTADVLAGLSPAADLAAGLPAEHAVRERFRNTCEVAGRLAHRLGMPPEVEEGLVAVFEQWDGRGPAAMKGTAIPLVSRIVYLTAYLEVFHRVAGREAATAIAVARRGKAFDPAIVDAFRAASKTAGFWEPLEAGPAWDMVLAMEPESPLQLIEPARFDDVVLAFADFADLKSPQSYGHSRRVGELAEQTARAAGLAAADVATVRTAALVHDLGQAAVASFLLEKPYPGLSPAEREQRNLHAHHTKRILSSIPGFEEVARLAGAHHERMDGRGYPQGVSAATLPRGARIIAAACRFDELRHPGDGTAGAAAGEAIEQMRQPGGVCPEALAALVRAVEGSPAPAPQRPARPAGLTEREVEVLRLATRGLSRREVAAALTVSEPTVRHHLEHIYAKLGVSTRVAAALFAVEHGLID